MYRCLALSLCFLAIIKTATAQQYTAGDLALTINKNGSIDKLRSVFSGRDYHVANQDGTLMQLSVNHRLLRPLRVIATKNTITLLYADNRKAVIKISTGKQYLKFTLDKISDGVDAVMWGPFSSSIADTIGNAVGVVRDREFAFGLQALNTKTSGGTLDNEEGAVYERGTAAIAQTYGSSLQAFTVNRLHDRVIKVWDRWPAVDVKGIKEGGLEGSSIALFGCRPREVLKVMETIEQENGLPHALWQNEWIKTSAQSGRAYMITTFNEQNIDTFLNYASRMGMAGVYHEDPFDTWGHFDLKKEEFPHGREGFKKCVEKAHALGLRLGFHTLTTFITTNDAFVTPVPDKGLATAGTDKLTADISAEATEIPVSDTVHFVLRSDLNSVLIGEEIIRFMGITRTAPYLLTGCTRGAFGTKRSAHKNVEAISRLVDHPYKVLYPGWELQKKVAKNIADFINQTGANQMDFDGHEGTYSNGMGDLSFNSFAEEVLKQSDHPVVFGSSRSNHYFWHFNNYLNWGEPWYGAFRESQSDLRITNQKFYEDNYLPNMLGWFLITAQTDPDDIEWMLARAAGFNAGYALVVREEALTNKKMDEIIALINVWTDAQNKRLFSQQQKDWLKNPANEAHLAKQNGSYVLESFSKHEFTHQAKSLQPGEPTVSNWSFDNTHEQQRPRIVLLAKGEEGRIKNPVIEIDNSFHLEVPVTLSAGESLLIDDKASAALYNSKGQLIRRIDLPDALPALSQGNHTFSFDAGMNINSPVKAMITIRLSEKTEKLAS